MSSILNIVSHSEQETAELAKRLATSFKPRDVLVLSGPLGSGKTVFVRGLAAGIGIKMEDVSSPSFTIMNEYKGNRDLYHFDLYRINDPFELYEAGWDEYLNRDGLIVVEWGEKAGDFLPSRYYLLEFEILKEHERAISISLVEG